MEPFDSGPGRKWLFFLFGAATFAFLLLRGLAGDEPAAFHWMRALGVLGFGMMAWRAHGLGVHADDHGLRVRTWSGARHFVWADVTDVRGEPRVPQLHLRDGTSMPLLDNWHADPESVAAEVRRRLHAHRGSVLPPP